MLDILEIFPGAKQHSGYWMAKCPAHPDQNPSLRIRVGETGLVVKCFAGCDFRSILVATGRKHFSFGAKTEWKPPVRTMVKTYDYTDEQGQLLYQKVRFEPKHFECRRPDGTGDWVWSLDDPRTNFYTRRVLYRLQALTKADRGRTVWVTEGEKDADAIVAMGLLATTNGSGGTQKWRQEFSDTLAARQVVLLPDNDRSGWHWMAEAAHSLYAAGCFLKVCFMPFGKDVSEWMSQLRERHQDLAYLRALGCLAQDLPCFPDIRFQPPEDSL